MDTALNKNGNIDLTKEERRTRANNEGAIAAVGGCIIGLVLTIFFDVSGIAPFLGAFILGSYVYVLAYSISEETLDERAKKNKLAEDERAKQNKLDKKKRYSENYTEHEEVILNALRFADMNREADRYQISSPSERKLIERAMYVSGVLHKEK